MPNEQSEDSYSRNRQLRELCERRGKGKEEKRIRE